MKSNNLLDSINYALQGIVHTLKTQRNMKIHFIIAFLVLTGSLFLEISKQELILLFIAISLVLAMELVNTALEIIIDMLTREYSFRAKIAKNISAGAVLISAFNAITVGYLIFVDEIADFSLNVIREIKKSPFHLTFINLGLLFILVISIKSFSKKGTPLKGGMPSGHSAIAFSIVTIIVFLSENILIGTLVLLLALFVVQSRIQSKTHTIVEVFLGALLGIFLTLIIFQLVIVR